ncbi:MAG: glycosyltransferase [Verrucomicrobiales bacterium]
MDEVWCKSRHAEAVFSQIHRKVIFVGFTSKDRSLSGVEPDYGLFFHLAGKSTMKNTSLLLDLWQCHPEWPQLTVVQHPSNAPKKVPGNVNLISRYLEDDELRRLQNCHGIHLCPSLSEGWGHYIAEAMSCRALVVTTDAPPMNELVSDGRGVLVPFSTSEPRHLGTVYRTRYRDIETVIGELLVMSIEQKRHLGEAARTWFEENSRNFKARVLSAMASDAP